MEQMIPLTIDGVKVEVPAGTTVLEAARIANVNIPTLCYLKDINETGNCRICVVDTGARTLQAACVLPVSRACHAAGAAGGGHDIFGDPALEAWHAEKYARSFQTASVQPASFLSGFFRRCKL